jgi:hypothetical protein
MLDKQIVIVGENFTKNVGSIYPLFGTVENKSLKNFIKILSALDDWN